VRGFESRPDQGKRIDDLRDAMNKRFDAIERPLEGIENLLTDHSRRITFSKSTRADLGFRKIPFDEDRLRLKRVLQSNRTGIPGGHIVRTAGDDRTEEELRSGMLFLYNLCWTWPRAPKSAPHPPSAPRSGDPRQALYAQHAYLR
jgi:hypothetical protein